MEAASQSLSSLLLASPLIFSTTIIMSVTLLFLRLVAAARPAAAAAASAGGGGAFQPTMAGDGPLLVAKRLASPSVNFHSTGYQPHTALRASAGVIPSLAGESFTPTGTRMPKVVHRVLSRADLKERVLVVGDVHGCLDELKALLEKTNYNKHTDSVVLVGDLVNKGPKSAETVKYVREQGFWSVAGNHDNAATAAYFRVGKYEGMAKLPPQLAYIDTLTEADVSFLLELPYTISIPHLNAIVVHAGLLPGRPIQEQLAVDMSRIRSVVVKEEDGSHEGVDYIKEHTIPWAQLWSEKGGPEHIIFGHDAKRMLQVYPKALGLDTGCCYGKELTLVILPGGERVSVPAFEVYQQPHQHHHQKSKSNDKHHHDDENDKHK